MTLETRAWTPFSLLPEGATLDRRARPAPGMFPKSGLSMPPCSSSGLCFYPLSGAGGSVLEAQHAPASSHSTTSTPLASFLTRYKRGVRGPGGARLRAGGPRQTQKQAACWPVPQMKSVRSRVWSTSLPASCTRGGGEKTRQTALGRVVRQRPSGNLCLATTVQLRGTVTTA